MQRQSTPGEATLRGRGVGPTGMNGKEFPVEFITSFGSKLVVYGVAAWRLEGVPMDLSRAVRRRSYRALPSTQALIRPFANCFWRATISERHFEDEHHQWCMRAFSKFKKFVLISFIVLRASSSASSSAQRLSTPRAHSHQTAKHRCTAQS